MWTERGKKAGGRCFPEDKVTGTFKANYKWIVGNKAKGHWEIHADWPPQGLWAFPNRPVEMLTGIKQGGINKECRPEKKWPKKQQMKENASNDLLQGASCFWEGVELRAARIKIRHWKQTSIHVSPRNVVREYLSVSVIGESPLVPRAEALRGAMERIRESHFHSATYSTGI